MNEEKFQQARKAITYNRGTEKYSIISAEYPDWLYKVIENAGGYCQSVLKTLDAVLDELTETPIEEIDADEIADSCHGVYYSDHWSWLMECPDATDFCDEALEMGTTGDFMSILGVGCYLSTLRAAEGLIEELSE